MSIETLSSDALDRRLRDLRGKERSVQVEFLIHLSEFDRRRGYATLGYPSLWEYCRKELGLLECATWRRTQSAQILGRFPIAADYLRDGRLAMTTLVLVQELLDEANVRDVLDRASNRSKREVEELVAAMRPRRDVATTVRKLPTPVALRNAAGNALGNVPVNSLNFRGPFDSAPDAPSRESTETSPTLAPTAGAELVAPTSAAVAIEFSAHLQQEMSPAKPATSRRNLDVEPLSADRFLLKMTVGREFLEALEKAKSILSHAEPTGDLIAVLRRGLEEVIVRDAKRHTPKPARPSKPARSESQRSESPDPSNAEPASAAAAESRMSGGPAVQERTAADLIRSPLREAIPEKIRAQVWNRDGGCCVWKKPSGGKCGSTWKLELDHVEPVARGGRSTSENLRLLCRAHNVQHAREMLGDEVIDRFRNRQGART